jgi:hypothetical protein
MRVGMKPRPVVFVRAEFDQATRFESGGVSLPANLTPDYHERNSDSASPLRGGPTAAQERCFPPSQAQGTEKMQADLSGGLQLRADQVFRSGTSISIPFISNDPGGSVVLIGMTTEARARLGGDEQRAGVVAPYPFTRVSPCRAWRNRGTFRSSCG